MSSSGWPSPSQPFLLLGSDASYPKVKPYEPSGSLLLELIPVSVA